MASTHPQARTRAPRRRTGRASTIAVIVLLLLGFGCLGYVGWEYFGTTAVAEKEFQRGSHDLHDTWGQPTTTSPAQPATGNTPDTHRTPYQGVVPGDAIALLRIPRLGADFEVPILEGTDLRHLNRGVGHYTGSAEAGDLGNFALAGHRVTHGEPFRRLLELRTGDQVIVETRTTIFTYQVTSPGSRTTVTDIEGGWAIQPVPCRPGTGCDPDAAPTRALITLTTCSDFFHSPDRSIVFGELVTQAAKS